MAKFYNHENASNHNIETDDSSHEDNDYHQGHHHRPTEERCNNKVVTQYKRLESHSVNSSMETQAKNVSRGSASSRKEGYKKNDVQHLNTIKLQTIASLIICSQAVQQKDPQTCLGVRLKAA